jgi:hypothetical protein
MRVYAIGLAALGWFGAGGVGPARAAEAAPVALVEKDRPGTTTRVIIELKAKGQARPAPPGVGPAKEGPPLPLKVETRFAFEERVRAAGPDGRALSVARRVLQAAATIDSQVRQIKAVLRPEVMFLVATLRAGVVVSASPAGPLTRPELELIEVPGDPLTLPDLLPDRPVKLGDNWTIGDRAARALSGYDALAANGLKATLETLDAASAQVRLAGSIRGAARGGEGTIQCSGSFHFDRKAGRIDRLTLDRDETRKPGPVEVGLAIKSTLTIERQGLAEPPPELTDASLAALPAEPPPEWEQLLYIAPNGKYTLRHDRDWHIFAEDTRLTVLKRLDHGEVVAQCNLAVGPNAGQGRHQDLDQFRSDIRRALGERFTKLLEAGELGGPPAGGFRYRVAVQGHEGNVGILWFYYLVASPQGDQLLAAFTLGASQAPQFADQDLRLIGSLEWTGAAAK